MAGIFPFSDVTGGRYLDAVQLKPAIIVYPGFLIRNLLLGAMILITPYPYFSTGVLQYNSFCCANGYHAIQEVRVFVC